RHRHLIHERLEQVVIERFDHRDVDRLAPQRLGRLPSAEAGPDDHHARARASPSVVAHGFFHSGLYMTAIRGQACATLGTPCSQVRWQDPPITIISPQPSMKVCTRAPLARGLSRNLRGSPSETVAT